MLLQNGEQVGQRIFKMAKKAKKAKTQGTAPDRKM